jgi:hypothetical protein
MKFILLLALLVLTLSAEASVKNCFENSKTFEAKVIKALEKGDLEIIIDEFETLF